MSRVLYIESALSIEHNSQEPDHPETQARLNAVRTVLHQSSIINDIVYVQDEFQVPLHNLAAVHSPQYLAKLVRAETMAQRRDHHLDPDTYFTKNTVGVLQNAAHSIEEAVDYALDTKSAAFCAVRPPSHHAGIKSFGGFCIANFSAYAAAYGASKGIEEIAIIDWDAHHGNGTQEIFYSDPSIFFMSLHAAAAYPASGKATAKGRGDGRGYTYNIPLRAGTTDDAYERDFQRGLDVASERIKPGLAVISAGFDAHASDPLGELNLSSEIYGRLTGYIRDRWPEAPVVSVLEGGYNHEALGASVLSHMAMLAN